MLSVAGYKIPVRSGVRHEAVIVDDHSLITHALSALMLDLDPGSEIHTANSANDALALVEAHGADADLLLLDLALPGVEGTSLLETLAATRPTLKILVVSGLQDQRSVMRVLRLGAAGFVPKTVDADVLGAAIRFVLGGGVYIPSNLLADAQRWRPSAPAVANPLAGPPVEITERQRDVLRELARGAPILKGTRRGRECKARGL